LASRRNREHDRTAGGGYASLAAKDGRIQVDGEFGIQVVPLSFEPGIRGDVNHEVQVPRLPLPGLALSGNPDAGARAGSGGDLDLDAPAVARQIARRPVVGLGQADRDRLLDVSATPGGAIAEALTNGVKHGGGAYFQVFETAKVAQVLIDDVGPGIDFSVLPKATLMTGFSTKASLGIGFSVMLEICDRVLLSTRPGRTRIVLEMGEARRARRAA